MRDRDCAYYSSQRAFTLIELSIVLVIIGLIVGGVLTGRSLIEASYVRAQMSQIEKINTAVNTFYEKYGYLPGDLTPTAATQFNFTVPASRTGTAGRGDGNGVLEGYDFGGASSNSLACNGENGWFWEDLTVNSRLMEGKFSTLQDAAVSSTTTITPYLPAGKLGSTFMYSYSYRKVNYIGLSAVRSVDVNLAINNFGSVDHSPGLMVGQAAAIDAKMDDGFPLTGRLLARYLDWTIATDIVYAAGGGVQGAGSNTPATPASATTCYDNGNSAGAKQAYSLSQSGGSGINCAVSFQLQ